MRGTFVTSKFEDRAALEAASPYETRVSTNAFVDAGLRWMWQVLTGEVRNEQGGLSDHLGKGRLIVGNGATPVERSDERLAGDLTAYAELDDGFPRIERTDDGIMLVLRATFAEQVANFDWRERGVTSVQGVLIDRAVQDQGRKAPGTVWTLQAELELLAGG